MSVGKHNNSYFLKEMEYRLFKQREFTRIKQLLHLKHVLFFHILLYMVFLFRW